jgi:hypothetical protein
MSFCCGWREQGAQKMGVLAWFVPWRGIAAAAIAAVTTTWAFAASAAGRPNILLILADD